MQIGEEIVLRRGELEVLVRDPSGRPNVVRLRPQVRPGEIVCERLGDIPLIVSDAQYAALLPPVEPLNFAIWMRHRVNVAHAKYMERTCYHLRCDWNMKTIINYLNGPGV